MRKQLTFVVSLAVLAIAPSGCGGSSSSTKTARGSSATATQSTTTATTFSSGYQSATVALEHTSKAVGSAIQHARGSSNAQLVAAFHALAGRWQSALSRLETLTPPPDLAASFNSLKDAVSRAESDLNAIVSAAETNNTAAAEQAGASLVADVAAARSADAPIRKQLGLK